MVKVCSSVVSESAAGVFEDQSDAGCMLLAIDDVRQEVVRPFDQPNFCERTSGDFYGFLVRCDAASIGCGTVWTDQASPPAPVLPVQPKSFRQRIGSA